MSFIELQIQSTGQYFEGIDSCVSLRIHLAKTRVIEAGKSHENFIKVANGHIINYSNFLCTDDAD